MSHLHHGDTGDALARRPQRGRRREKTQRTNTRSWLEPVLMFVPCVFPGGAYGAKPTRATELLTHPTEKNSDLRVTPCPRGSVLGRPPCARLKPKRPESSLSVYGG